MFHTVFYIFLFFALFFPVTLSRWSKCLGDLSRGEEQTWPEVWHPLPIHGLCLRCTYKHTHHRTDCWCIMPTVISLPAPWFCNFNITSHPSAVRIPIFLCFSISSLSVSFCRGAGKEVFPPVRAACLSLSWDMVRNTLSHTFERWKFLPLTKKNLMLVDYSLFPSVS